MAFSTPGTRHLLALSLLTLTLLASPARAAGAPEMQTPAAQTPAAQATPVQDTPNPPEFSLNLENIFTPRYLRRFSSVQGVADPLHGYGVRAFPLPFTEDVRAAFVNHQTYLEYGVSVRLNDTSFVAGKFENTDTGATDGVTHLEVRHDPAAGVQYGVLYQDKGRSSRVTLGYAQQSQGARILDEVGYAVQGKASAFYVRLQANGNQRKVNGPLTASASEVARAYVFATGAQFSTDLYGSLSYRPTSGTTITLSEFERFAFGVSPIPDLAYGRYSQTNLDVVLLPDSAGKTLALRAIEYHGARSFLQTGTLLNTLSATVRLDAAPALVVDVTPHYDFVLNEPGVRTDLYYRSAALPTLIGPSFDSVWGKTGQRWIISLRAATK